MMRLLLYAGALTIFPVLVFAEDVQLAPGRAAPVSASTSSLDEDYVEATVFDLYLSDKFQGSILVRYTDNWFEIDDPRDVIDQLKEVKQGEKLEKLLEGRIERTRYIKELGAVRYDLRTFRIILDLDQSFLPTQQLNLLNRLPDPENKFSLQQSVRGASSGELDEEFNSALTHRTIASRGKYFSLLDGTYVQDSDYLLTEASVGGIIDEYETSVGLLDTKGQAFAQTVDIAGFEFETSEDIFLDQDKIRGSRLELFVPARSRVEFFREDRLLAVQVLDFGLQEIDTTQFPDGSYDIDIIMTEDSGNITRERRFFTKSGYLAIQSRPIFFAQIGTLRDGLDFLNIPVYQTGLRWRASSILELKGSIYGTDKIQLGDVAAVGVWHDYLFGAGGTISTEGDSGITGNVSGSLFGFNLNLSAAETLSGGLEETDPIVIVDPNGRQRLSPENRAKLVSRERSSLSAGIGKSFGKVTLRFSGNRNNRPQTLILNDPTVVNPMDRIIEEDRYAFGPRVEWRILDGAHTLRLDTALLDTDEGRKTAVSLVYRYAFDQHLSYNSELSSRRESSGDESLFRNTFTYDNKERSELGSRLTYSNEARSVEKPESDKFTTNQLSGEHTNNYLAGVGFVRDIRLNEDPSTATGINAESSFIYNEESGISVSHPPKKGAVFIADLRTGTAKGKFELTINGQTYATIEAGRKTVIGLEPYRTYRISIRPVEEKELVSFSNKTYEVTLFPGNVVRKTWEVEKIFIAVGRLVNEDGDPIINQRIKGTLEYTVTDESGNFQAEIKGTEALYIDSKTMKCRIEYSIPEEASAFVVDLGDTLCKPGEIQTAD